MTMLRRTLPTLFDDTNERPTRFSELVDRLFDDAMDINRNRFLPQMDVAETDKEFEITVVLPGLTKDDIDIHFENNILTISGERRWKQEEENGRRFHRVETGYGKFSRSLPLPNIVDSDKINAEFRNGELYVTVPKLKEKAGKKIKVS